MGRAFAQPQGLLAPEQVRRFLVGASGGTYRVCDELRDICTFAVHDILRAPRFSRMDLISCRNLFIYFDAAIKSAAAAV